MRASTPLPTITSKIPPTKTIPATNPTKALPPVFRNERRQSPPQASKNSNDPARDPVMKVADISRMNIERLSRARRGMSRSSSDERRVFAEIRREDPKMLLKNSNSQRRAQEPK